MVALVATDIADRAFDAWHGADTRGTAALDDLGAVEGALEHAEPYEPTRVLALRSLFRRLDLPEGGVLVDFGCGKGRVLLVASRFGFREVRGIEFSASLCDVARENVARLRRRSGRVSEFQVIHADAGTYEVRGDENVFFMFNLFDDHIVRRVMAAITRSWQASPRPMTLIYRRPVHREWIIAGTPFVQRDEYVLWGSDFAVFEAQGLPAGPGLPAVDPAS